MRSAPSLGQSIVFCAESNFVIIEPLIKLRLVEKSTVKYFVFLEDADQRKEVCQTLWWGLRAAEGGEEKNEQVTPHQFLCPITHDIMKDPVLCSGMIVTINILQGLTF